MPYRVYCTYAGSNTIHNPISAPRRHPQMLHSRIFLQSIRKSLAVLRTARMQQQNDNWSEHRAETKLLGAHIEGPFLAMSKVRC